MIKHFGIEYERENETRYSMDEINRLKDVIEKNKYLYEEIK